MKILILAKKSKPYVKEIVEIAKANFKSVEFLNVEKKNFNFKGLYNKKFDYILSYINDKVVPKKYWIIQKYLILIFIQALFHTLVLDALILHYMKMLNFMDVLFI